MTPSSPTDPPAAADRRPEAKVARLRPDRPVPGTAGADRRPTGRSARAGGVRLTWAQPEDLVGHELRQAAEDGRDPGPALTAWSAAGGHPAPERAGASPAPAPPHLRALAARLLDELALLPSPLSADEPASWAAVVAACGQAVTTAGSPAPPVPATAHPNPHPGPAATGPAATSGAGPAPVPGGARHGPASRPQREGFGPGHDHGHDHGLLLRLEAAWVGRAVGCLLGKPVEKLPLEGIRALARAAGNWPLDDWFTARGVPAELLAAYPWNRRSAATSLAENIDGMPEDDDLNYPLLNLRLLQRFGKAFTTADVARLWLDELPAGRTFTAERVAYRNLLLGLEPPATATHHNPFREWIGALIRADVHGWTNPGDPATAAAQAYRDAALTHTGNGVYAALFVAAATATAATGRADVHTCLRAGLAAVPPRSRLAEAIRFGVRAATEEAGFDPVVDRLHARYGHYHWVHAVPNTALIAAALTHADGDFTRSVCRAVSGGWDTDSNGATAGALAGLLAGSPDRIPHRWSAPLKNRLATTVPGFDGIGFDTLAHLTAQEAARS
ncbi:MULTISPECIES: ADP-ribosylglycohydrolase family protein [Streptomyces]|uniref:ADP-ribosylglycohydrolase family protein n=1 Tax=Streptomyces TaxID=1883 RepID=UPI00099C7527|nr:MULTISPECIES: ADP-ribosylglycohydrolase family protein [unclassified Streptomyces]MCI4080989.1 ADP-ribosylglycohydrolase family protein [Streptomyces sp. MMS21 TC-5]